MTKCEYCGHEFHNLTMRRDCPRCGRLLNAEREDASKQDDGPDIAGFVVGYATGIPISPSHGISGAAMLGAALHSSQSQSQSAPEPAAGTIEHENHDTTTPDSSGTGESSGGSDGGVSSGGGGE